MSNVLLAWIFYILTAVIFYAIFWYVTRFRQRQFLSYSMRAVMLAIIITPWYISDQGNALAPALIIVLMDLITIGPEAAPRAMVPLLLSLILSVVLVAAGMLIARAKRRKRASVID